MAETKAKLLPGRYNLEELREQLMSAEDRERIERFLKNEAYAYIMAEGLLDKFLEFRTTSLYRTKKQESTYKPVMEANLGGLWIDG